MESTTYYSGIDLHKRTSYIATINQHGETVKEANLKNHNAIARLLGKFNAKNDEQLPRPYHLQLRCYQEQITLLNEQIRALEAALHPQFVPNPDIQRLAHLPGIGFIVAYTLYFTRAQEGK